MNRSVWIALGAVSTVGLIVLGLWGWERAEAIVTLAGWEKRTIGVWSVRCAVAALIAAAEAILLALVVERVYRPDAVCRLVKLSALLTCMVCTVSAIALGLAGR
jgi:quinol-cytochrome oxidoreductase complex cytochrome b subunit